MPFDGSGNFDRLHNWVSDKDAAIKIRADRHDEEDDNFASGLTACLAKDGQSKPTADLDWDNNKITNLKDATSAKDALNLQSAQAGAYHYTLTTGSANTYVGSLVPSITALTNALTVLIKANHNNTGASTFNLNSLGAKNIYANGLALVGGEIVSGGYYYLHFNSADDRWQIDKPSASETLKGIVEFATNAETVTGTSTTLATHPAGVEAAIAGSLALFGGKSGLILQNDTDTEHDIKINSGICVDSTKTVIMDFSTSNIIKRIDANWVEGSNQGGFPSGISLSPNTKYYVFLISKMDGTIDAGFDSSKTATNLLSNATGYIYYRRVGGIKTNSSSNIYQFTQYDNLFKLNDPIEELNDNSPSVTSNISLTLSIPNAIVDALVNVRGDVGTSVSDVLRYTFGSNNQTLTSSNHDGRLIGDAARYQNSEKIIPSNNGNIKYSVYDSSGTRVIVLTLLGWYDHFID